MADIVTGTVTGSVDTSVLQGEHADIRMEQANQASDIRMGSAVGQGAIIDAVKTAGWANSDRTGNEADRVTNQATQNFIAGQQYAFDNARDVAALKAMTDMQFANLLNSIQTQGALSAAAAALESEKVAAAVALGQAKIEQTVTADGNTTRALINSLNADELNRRLIERNAELVEHRGHGRYWEGQFNNAQQANLVSQINALSSQFQETRQGMVNFGTMAGVGQSSTSNNVR